MTSCNVKNYRERHRHQVEMAALTREQKIWEVQAKRDISSTRSELLSMRAYRKVYRDYSFYKGHQRQHRHQRRRRQRTPAKVTFRAARDPEIDDEDAPEDEKDTQRPVHDRHAVSERTPRGTSEQTHENVNAAARAVTSRSADEAGIVRLLQERLHGGGAGDGRPAAGDGTLRPPKHPKHSSLTSKSANASTKGTLRQELLADMNQVDQSMQNLNLRVVNDQKVDILVVNPSDGGNTEADVKPKSGRNVKYVVVEAKNFARPKIRKLSPRKDGEYGGQSAAKSQRKSVFPAECRNTFALRRLMDEKAEKLITEWSPESRRKREVKKILAKVTFPQLVSRDQTTSAIFRDYKHLKERSGRTYSPSLGRKTSAKEVTFDIAKVVRLPPMTQEEKVDMLHRAESRPKMAERSSTVA